MSAADVMLAIAAHPLSEEVLATAATALDEGVPIPTVQEALRSLALEIAAGDPLVADDENALYLFLAGIVNDLRAARHRGLN